MIDELLKGIVQALEEAYGQDVPVYLNEEPKTPDGAYFVVRMYRADKRALTGGREERTYAFDIMYYTDGEKNYQEMYGVGEQLTKCLQLLPFGESKVRGAAQSYQVIEGALHNYVSYRISGMNLQVQDAMDTYEIHTQKG